MQTEDTVGPDDPVGSPPGRPAATPGTRISRVVMEQLYYDLWGHMEGHARPAGGLRMPHVPALPEEP